SVNVDRAVRAADRWRYQWVRMLRRSATAAMRTGDDLESMTIGIVEVHTAPVVPGIGVTGILVHGVRPIINAALLDARKDLVELRLGNQERIMQPIEIIGFRVAEVECGVFADR